MIPPEDSEILSALAVRGHSVNFMREEEKRAERWFHELMRRAENIEISMGDEPSYEEEHELEKAQDAATQAEAALHNVQLRLEWESRDGRRVQ